MAPEPAGRLEAGGTNAIGRMLGVLGDEWNLLIIQQAVLGSTRYGDFTARLPISHAVLANRLRALTAAGLLKRTDVGYLPTARSRSLWPLLVLIWEWERSWVPDHPWPLPSMRHQGCEKLFSPVLRCSACAKEVEPGTVDLTLGPSGDWERSMPMATTRRRSDSHDTARTAGLFPETMTVLGNRWAVALLLAAFLGASRYTDFQSHLAAPPSLLSERLQTFCGLGVLHCPERGVYTLTDKGRAFFPVLLIAIQWAQRWYRAPEGPAIIARHHECDEPLTAELACSRCNCRLAGADVLVVSAAAGSENP